MTKHILVGVLLSCLLPAAFADGIYRKDDSGSVELSNLADEDGYEEVVRAAPAPRAAARQASVPAARAPAAVPAAAVRSRAIAEEEATLAQETTPAADVVPEPATADTEMNASAVSGVATVMPGGMSNGMSPVSAPSHGLNTPSPASPVQVGDGSQQTPTAPIAQPTPTPILDSPQQLAARLQNYREMMVNEAVQAASLPPNPAVVRRYLMTNRATYMSNRR